LYKKNIVQETMLDGQVSCTSRLVQVSCSSFLTVCHHHYARQHAAISAY